MPVDRFRQHAAGQQPDRAAGDGNEGVDADRLGLLSGLGEHGHDHAQDHRRRQRPANALDEARHDQDALALGAGAHQRRAGEHGEADEEDAPLTDQVPDPPGEQQQAAEGDQVCVDHPREVVLREAEVHLDGGQGDVDDRRVEHDHQHADAEHVQRQPPPPVLHPHPSHPRGHGSAAHVATARGRSTGAGAARLRGPPRR